MGLLDILRPAPKPTTCEPCEKFDGLLRDKIALQCTLDDAQQTHGAEKEQLEARAIAYQKDVVDAKLVITQTKTELSAAHVTIGKLVEEADELAKIGQTQTRLTLCLFACDGISDDDLVIFAQNRGMMKEILDDA